MKIKFDLAAAPYVKERQWYKNQELTDGKNGSVILTSKDETTHMDQVARWVLSWGKNAKVMSPKVLVELVKAELKAASKQYKK